MVIFYLGDLYHLDITVSLTETESEEVDSEFNSLRSLAVFGELGRGILGSSPARGEIRPAQKLCVFEFRPLATCLFTQALNDNCNEL